MAERKPPVAVFEAVKPGLYDLKIDGRASAYDLEPEDFAAALRRARFTGTEAWVEDLTGYRERLGRR